MICPRIEFREVRNARRVKDAQFHEAITVKAVFDDEYEYTGEAVYENKNIDVRQLYVGSYFCLCQLPVFITTDKLSPLRMITTINGSEFTYNIRK